MQIHTTPARACGWRCLVDIFDGMFSDCYSVYKVATSVDAPYAEIVFYSLMNTVLGTIYYEIMLHILSG